MSQPITPGCRVAIPAEGRLPKQSSQAARRLAGRTGTVVRITRRGLAVVIVPSGGRALFPPALLEVI